MPLGGWIFECKREPNLSYGEFSLRLSTTEYPAMV